MGDPGRLRYVDLDTLNLAAEKWPDQECWDRMAFVAAVGFAKINRFTRPSAAMPKSVHVGAMGERYIEPRRVLCDSIRQFSIARGEVEARVVSQTAKLVARLEAAIAECGDDETLREDYSDWLDVARRPPPIHEIEEPLFEVACEAWDARLAALPLPNGARPVATAPLPPLPDPPGSFEIPPGATLMDALTPAVARGARRALAAVHGYLLEMAKVALRGGHPSEVPKPILSMKRRSYPTATRLARSQSSKSRYWRSSSVRYLSLDARHASPRSVARRRLWRDGWVAP